MNGKEPRPIDAHDVRAFVARAKEAADEAERRATKAVGDGWILERVEFGDHAGAWLARARAALDELEACMRHTLEQDQAAQEAEAAALLGDDL